VIGSLNWEIVTENDWFFVLLCRRILFRLRLFADWQKRWWLVICPALQENPISTSSFADWQKMEQKKD